MENGARKKIIVLILLSLVILFAASAEGRQKTHTQSIVLIAVVPPVPEYNLVACGDDLERLAASIQDLDVENGVVIDLMNISSEALDEVLVSCISKLAEEISCGAFAEGSNAGMLIRTNNSQFKISQYGISYTSIDSVGQSEIRRIIKSLVDDYSIDSLHLAKESGRIGG